MVRKSSSTHPKTTIFLFNIDPIFDLQQFFDVTVFVASFFCIFGPILRVMALGTVTVRSASKFHAERSGREIQGSHGDPFRVIFCFQLRPPLSGEQFFEPAPQFKSLPPPFVPPTSNPTPKSTPFVSPKNDQTAADIHRLFESMSTTSIF